MTQFIVVDAEEQLAVLSTHKTEKLAKAAAWRKAREIMEPDCHDEMFAAEWGDDCPGFTTIGIERDAIVGWMPADMLPTARKFLGLD